MWRAQVEHFKTGNRDWPGVLVCSILFYQEVATWEICWDSSKGWVETSLPWQAVEGEGGKVLQGWGGWGAQWANRLPVHRVVSCPGARLTWAAPLSQKNKKHQTSKLLNNQNIHVKDCKFGYMQLVSFLKLDSEFVYCIDLGTSNYCIALSSLLSSCSLLLVWIVGHQSCLELTVLYSKEILPFTWVLK